MTFPQQTPSPGYPQGYGYPPGQGYGYGAAPAPTPSNGLAITALVLGIISLIFGIIPFLGWIITPFAIAAVGFGFAGLSRGKRVGRGRGMATGGLITGLLALLAITAWTAVLVVDARNKHDLFTGSDRYFGCDATRDSYEGNVEDFRSDLGREPTSEDELIDEGYRTWASGDWDVVITDGRAEVVRQPGGDC